MNLEATVELQIPSHLYERAKALAQTQGKSFDRLICDALEEAVTPPETVSARPEATPAAAHHYLDESGHLLEGIETNLRPLHLPGCVAAFEGTLPEVVDFLNTFEHLDITCNSIRGWMARHFHKAWELGHYLVMRTHKKRGHAFLYVLEIRNCELPHCSANEKSTVIQ